MATKSKEFVKQFLYRDDERIEAAMTDYQRSLDKINDVFPKVEKIIEREFTNEERIEFANHKSEMLLNILRPRFPFPNADAEFNLQALGLNIQSLLSELNNLPGIYCQTVVSDKRLLISQTTLNEIEEANTQYTENENQNKALELANRLVAGFEEAEAMGLIDKYGIGRIEQVTKLLHSPLGSGNRIVPNRYTIRNIM